MPASQQSTTRRANATPTQPAATASAGSADKENRSNTRTTDKSGYGQPANGATNGNNTQNNPSARARRPSARQKQLDDEAQEAEDRRAEKQAKAAKAARRREAAAAGVEDDEEDSPEPRQDDTFASRVVPSKPAATKNLVQRSSKIPDAPRPSPAVNHHTHTDGNRGRRDTREDDRSRVTFRGMSPAHSERSPSPQAFDINGRRVPNNVSLHLFSSDDDSESPVRHHRRDDTQSPVRRRSPAPRRHRSPSPAPRQRHSDSPAPRRRRSPSPPPRRQRERRRSPSTDDNRSTSPAAGDKRARSPSDDLRVVQAQRTSTTSRPKAHDFDDITQEALAVAIKVYRCFCAGRHAFPDHTLEVSWVCEAWALACRKVNINMELTPTLTKLITKRGTHLRGEVKTKARPIVELQFGFKRVYIKFV